MICESFSGQFIPHGGLRNGFSSRSDLCKATSANFAKVHANDKHKVKEFIYTYVRHNQIPERFTDPEEEISKYSIRGGLIDKSIFD